MCHRLLWNSTSTSDPRGIDYSIDSSPTISFLLMILKPPFFFIVSTEVDPPLASPLLLSILRFPTTTGGSRTEFRSPTNSSYRLSFSPLSRPTSVLLLLVFIKLVGMSLIFISISIVFLQNNTSLSLSLFSAAALFTALAPITVKFFIFLAESNANFKPGGFLK